MEIFVLVFYLLMGLLVSLFARETPDLHFFPNFAPVRRNMSVSCFQVFGNIEDNYFPQTVLDFLSSQGIQNLDKKNSPLYPDHAKSFLKMIVFERVYEITFEYRFWLEKLLNSFKQVDSDGRSDEEIREFNASYFNDIFKRASYLALKSDMNIVHGQNWQEFPTNLSVAIYSSLFNETMESIQENVKNISVEILQSLDESQDYAKVFDSVFLNINNVTNEIFILFQDIEVGTLDNVHGEGPICHKNQNNEHFKEMNDRLSTIYSIVNETVFFVTYNLLALSFANDDEDALREYIFKYKIIDIYITIFFFKLPAVNSLEE